MEQTVDRLTVSERVPWALLIVALIFSSFAYGKFHFAPAAWIYPACLLFFMRSQNVRTAALCSFVMFAVSLNIAFFSSLSEYIADPLSAVLYTCLAVPILIPFFIDRICFEKASPVQRLFIFPFAWAACDFLMSLLPLGMASSIAYSQINFAYLTQSLSVIGPFGITFLLGLLATSILSIKDLKITEHRVDWKAVACLGVIAIVVVAGGVRLNSNSTDGPEARVMCVSGPDSQWVDTDIVTDYSVSTASLDNSMSNAVAQNVDLLMYSEEAFSIEESRVNDFLHHAETISDASGIPILISMDIVDSHNKVLQNVCSLVVPDGGHEWTYYKSHLVPVMEQGVTPGDEEIYNTETDLGNVSSIICMDAEFPHYINKISSHTDILLVPAWEWGGIEYWHSYNISYRAIENGFNVVKHTNDGLSVTYDPYGRIHGSQMNFPSDDTGYFILNVHTEGTTTVYGQFGQVIDWLYVIGFVLVLTPFLFLVTRKP